MLAKWEGHLSDARPLEQWLASAMCVMILALGICPWLLTRYYGAVANSTAAVVNMRMPTPMPIGYLPRARDIVE
jgi:NADH:ubiquinone oxidoreductase subunit 4 (subunit M)